MELYKGYVKTKNKKCIEKFKNVKNLKSYDDVKNLNEFAGILDKNIVLIDIDNENESEILFNIVNDKKINTRVIKTTRGMHFYFKNDERIQSNKTDTKLFLGINSDIKIGSRNSYSIVKFGGKERPIIYDSESLDTVPKFLLPTIYKFDFLDLEEGDGRNQELFNYILILQSNGFSKEEVRECIRLINSYVISEPMSENELETILRDEAFKDEIFFKNKKFLFDKFSNFIVSNSHIKRINSRLHVYKDGVYIDGQEEIEREMIKSIPSLKRNQRSECLAYINLLVSEDNKLLNPNLIAFENGIYDLDNDEILDFSPEIMIRNKINYDYYNEAYDELCDKTLNKISCNDKEIRMLLEELIGYCFFTRNELGKAFILVGDKANGKSTFLSLLQVLLGDDNISSLDLSELGDRFKTAELFGKLANIGDDIGDEFVANPALFKKLVTGDRVNVEKKGQDPFEFNNYSKFIFSANQIPRIKDRTGAVQRRLIIIPFNANFSKDDPDFDPYIKHKLLKKSSLEYLIRLGINGLKRVLKNKSFTKSEKVQKELDEYEKNNNPILLFFDEVNKEEIINESVPVVYRMYTVFCSENNFSPFSKIEFGRNISSYYGLVNKAKRINGKLIRIWVEDN